MTNALQHTLVLNLPTTFTVLFLLLMAGALWRFFAPASGEMSTKPKALVPLRDLALYVLGWAVLSRLLVLVIAYIASGFDLPHVLNADHWTRWDADHYLGIADNWYVNEGDSRFHIVFYPLYPLLVMGAKWLFLGRTELAAYAVSNMCFFGCCCALYRLVEMEQGNTAARRAVRLLCLCPMTVFYSLPYSESLFLLLTLLSVLTARQGRMGWALFLGALAATTRMLGLLCAVPVFYEYWRKAQRQDGRFDWRQAIRGFFMTCLIALGFAAYLCLNRHITGDWLRFLTYQREHWNQTFGSLGNSVRYTLLNLFEGTDEAAQHGVWLPQIVSMALVMLALGLCWRKAHPGDNAYAVLYFYVALAPTWLLSGARYLGAMYALYPILAHLTQKKRYEALVMASMIIGLVYCTVQYAVAGTMF